MIQGKIILKSCQHLLHTAHKERAQEHTIEDLMHVWHEDVKADQMSQTGSC